MKFGGEFFAWGNPREFSHSGRSFWAALGRAGFGLGIETALALAPPPILSLIADRWLLGYTSYLSVMGRPLLQLDFLLAALLRRCSQRRFREGATFWFHICMPCYPGSGWGRQLWPARYPGLGDCWGLVGVG